MGILHIPGKTTGPETAEEKIAVCNFKSRIKPGSITGEMTIKNFATGFQEGLIFSFPRGKQLSVF